MAWGVRQTLLAMYVVFSPSQTMQLLLLLAKVTQFFAAGQHAGKLLTEMGATRCHKAYGQQANDVNGKNVCIIRYNTIQRPFLRQGDKARVFLL
jgi:hypothetical protein